MYDEMAAVSKDEQARFFGRYQCSYEVLEG